MHLTQFDGSLHPCTIPMWLGIYIQAALLSPNNACKCNANACLLMPFIRPNSSKCSRTSPTVRVSKSTAIRLKAIASRLEAMLLGCTSNFKQAGADLRLASTKEEAEAKDIELKY